MSANKSKPTQQFDMAEPKQKRKSPSNPATPLQKRARQMNWNKALLKSSCAALRRIALDSKLSQGNYSQLIKEVNAMEAKLLLQIETDYKKDKVSIQAFQAMEAKNKESGQVSMAL